MQMYVISDNNDTYMGLRLTGVGGCVVHTEKELSRALERALADKNIGILLLTEKLVDLAPEKISRLKQTLTTPLLVVIPDRHGTGRNENAIAEYISLAIGIKI